ncbi:MAG: YgfZ/GcvT domain-containing protein [Nevskiaceae bacterium]
MTDQHPTIAVALTHLGLVEAGGADAATFLQGQLSNDIRALAPARAQLSSYNSAKGRMLAVLHVLPHDDGFLLELQRSLLETVLKRLKMYVLRSKVTLAEAERTVFGLAGPDAASVLADIGVPAPIAPLDCAWHGDLCVMRRIGEVPRYTLLAPGAHGAELWPRIARRARAGSLDDWKRSEIEAGVPTVYPQTQDRFVAQMCNLDALGGISFDKGCYTGQEIIARVHYRGAVKRHMTQQRLDGPPPAPGTKLDSGEVVDAVADPRGGSIALLVSAPA